VGLGNGVGEEVEQKAALLPYVLCACFTAVSTDIQTLSHETNSAGQI